MTIDWMASAQKESPHQRDRGNSSDLGPADLSLVADQNMKGIVINTLGVEPSIRGGDTCFIEHFNECRRGW